MYLETLEEELPGNSFVAHPLLIFNGTSRFQNRISTNIRAAGFIAKPESVDDLANCINGPLMGLLCQIAGFSGAVVLRAHKEGRSVTVLTFWKTEAQAMQTCWEEFSAVCQMLYPLVDVCTRVQTFHGTMAELC
ncbi:MAG: hypothetical protein ACRD40_00570 [Candidatus Acidiferrales bacterium]